jgi:F0F1-type ATP synthase assembly protein I
MSTGVTISATLLSGILVWGAIGYLIDRLAGTGQAFTAAGMLLGAGLAIYVVYLRYGRGDAGGADDRPKR